MVKKPAAVRSNPNLALGAKLRNSRRDASLTMQTVADRAGLSVGFISQVERGLAAPSLSSLRSIAGALGRPISFYLDQPESRDAGTVATRRVSYRVAGGPIAYERLSASFPGSAIRAVIIHEPPGHRSEPISHEGEELFYMLRGEITAEIDGERRILREGDSIHFDSRRVHSTWNHGTDTACLLWCGTMDVFGEFAPDPVRKASETKSKGDRR